MIYLESIFFFDRIVESKNVFFVGVGGGFDIYFGVFIYLNLVKVGKNVILVNYFFILLEEMMVEEVYLNCYKVRIGDLDRLGRNYFLEKYLCLFLGVKGIYVIIYGLKRVGVQFIFDFYRYIVKEYEIDMIILVDGGMDSLMFGDEEGLGILQEDICLMVVVYRIGIKNKMLLSIGFGVDYYYGVFYY